MKRYYYFTANYSSNNNIQLLDRVDKHDITLCTVQSNGLITIQYVSKIFAPCQYDPESWPFEEWTCDFTLASSSNSTSAVVLEPFDPRYNIVSS